MRVESFFFLDSPALLFFLLPSSLPSPLSLLKFPIWSLNTCSRVTKSVVGFTMINIYTTELFY